MKLKLKFKLYYIIQLSYYNSESRSLTVGAKDQIKKAQPVSEQQLKTLREENRID